MGAEYLNGAASTVRFRLVPPELIYCQTPLGIAPGLSLITDVREAGSNLVPYERCGKL